jgi:hypothetical protein
MAIGTAGTNATTSLTAYRWVGGYGSGLLAADYATLNADVLQDNTSGRAVSEGFAIDSAGWLTVPGRRHRLLIKPQDVILIDSTGWPMLLSANAAANGPWTLTV